MRLLKRDIFMKLNFSNEKHHTVDTLLLLLLWRFLVFCC